MLRDLGEDLKHEILGILLVAAAGFGLISLVTDRVGWFGQHVSSGLYAFAGWGAFVLPLVVAGVGVNLVLRREAIAVTARTVGAALLYACALTLLHFPFAPVEPDGDPWKAAYEGRGGGLAGAAGAWALGAAFGVWGRWIVLAAIALSAFLMTTGTSIAGPVERLRARVSTFLRAWKEAIVDLFVVRDAAAASTEAAAAHAGGVALAERGPAAGEAEGEDEGDEDDEDEADDDEDEDGALDDEEEEYEDEEDEDLEEEDEEDEDDEEDVDEEDEDEEDEDEDDEQDEDEEDEEDAPRRRSRGRAVARRPGRKAPVKGARVGKGGQLEFDEEALYQLPPVTLLAPGVKANARSTQQDVAERAKLLEETLQSFGVSARVVEIHPGPAVTRYELQPAKGVKVARITNLHADLALALAAPHIRIEAPIPGKAAVGIEVPNREKTVVALRDLLESPEFRGAQGRLVVALGKDIAGRPVLANLEQMPHLLIAGSTGSGKSVCINTLIMSLLYRARPDEVKLMMIDPKMVELQSYNGIPHLIAPVVTDPKKAAGFLRWAVKEMENRYELFAAAGVRDIGRYNALQAEQGKAHSGPALPHVVIILDELADLMMVAPVDVEDAIMRLAQMARAAGMHLVVATQRPSVDVITGVIKANIPSRIAFAVASQVDSRTILDAAGAEKLLGKGDMLYFPLGANKPQRVQGCYVSEKEVEAVVAFCRKQGAQPEYHAEALPLEGGEREREASERPADELLPKATRVCLEHGQASVSILQRRLRVSYNRAARIIDDMEKRGLIGPYQGSKPRELRITMEDYARIFGSAGDGEEDEED